MYDFTGRTILVTGAAGGIGGETVRRLRACGADVLASSKTADSLGPIAEETGARPLAFDLESEQSIESALDGLVVDGVVNCGGWGGEIATPMDTNVDVFDSVIRINARGTLLVTKHAARAMVAAKRPGAIVNVSSQASLVALPGHISYAASKAAVDSITRVAADHTPIPWQLCRWSRPIHSGPLGCGDPGCAPCGGRRMARPETTCSWARHGCREVNRATETPSPPSPFAQKDELSQ